MTRKQALIDIDQGIANAAGNAADIAILEAHKARMIAGWKAEDAKLEIRIARRKAATAEWMANIDFRVR